MSKLGGGGKFADVAPNRLNLYDLAVKRGGSGRGRIMYNGAMEHTKPCIL